MTPQKILTIRRNPRSLVTPEQRSGAALRRSWLLVLLALGCFVLCPVVQAVVPVPDGAYPGGNTAEGENALLSLTSGTYNTAVGWISLPSLTDGKFNTGLGAGTLVDNTADNNTAAGAGALLNNTTGDSNTATGAFALFSNTTGSANTVTGDSALSSNTTGFRNTAIGAAALFSNTTGPANTAIGFRALTNNTIGGTNTANGYQALSSNTTGIGNTAIGNSALDANTTGNDNIALGVAAGSSVATADNVISIGAAGANVSDTTWIDNIYATTTVSATTLPVVVSDSGQLGTASSSARFKKEIKPMDKASETILALKPVTFHYKSDNTNIPQFGLIAEDVAKVNPDLIVRDKNGEIYTVRYDAVNAMLLNEFLKEHKKVEEQARETREEKSIIDQLKASVAKQEATITQQQADFQLKLAEQEKQIEALTSGLQKVSAQLEASKSEPQMVESNQ